MFSNMYVNPANLQHSNGHLIIHYDVIVKNIDTKAHSINLQDSRIVIAKNNYPMSCHRYREKDRKFQLVAREQARILCTAKIQKRGFPKSDYQSILELPLDQDVAKFEYLLRAEDFQ